MAAGRRRSKHHHQQQPASVAAELGGLFDASSAFAKMPCFFCIIFCLHLVTTSPGPSAASSSSETGGSSSGGSGEVIRYRVFEELPPNTFIGNIKTNSNLLERYGRTVFNQLELDFQQTSRALAAYFRLDRRQGSLWTAKVLDREQLLPLTDLELSIRVTPFQYFQILKVIVTIVDKNDNIPTFPDASLSLVLSETTKVDSVFALPSAEDKDGWQYGVQMYELISTNDKFEIKMTNNSDGSMDVRLVLAKELDREREESYDMSLVAWDGGQPPQSGHISISVIVLDANDNSPRFQKTEYQVSVSEDAHYGLLLLRLSATDADTGVNGQVIYGFASNTDDALRRVFHVNNVTGDVTLRARLDYEQSRTHTFTVAAHDLGHNPLTSFAKVTVRVLDINDNGPHITVHALGGQGEAVVTENCPPGTLVTQLAVTDADDGDNGRVNCSLEGHMFNLQRLSPTEFKVTTRGSFDREERELHQVRITCADGGRPPLSAMRVLSVNVIDENDNTPAFASPVYSVVFKENNSVGAVVIKMNATDEDAGAHARTVYSMKEVSNTPRRVMSIDSSTGTVRALVALDYESSVRHFVYVVTATDSGAAHRSSTTLLNVTLADVNDEAPRFSNASYTFTIRENTSPPLEIGIISATDADSSSFNRILYTLAARSPLSADCFAIDRHSGLLITLKSLDREVLDLHELFVTASNGNDVIVTGDDIVERDVISSSITVTIRLTDENDNAPIFVFPSRYNSTVHVADSATVGSVAAVLLVNDPDLNSKVTLDMTGGDKNGLFNLDPSRGVLLVAKPLNGYADLEFEILLSAVDDGQPPLRSSEALYVRVVHAPPPPTLDLGRALGARAASLLRGDSISIVIAVAGGLLLVFTCVLIVVCIRCCRSRQLSKRQKSRELRVATNGKGSSSLQRIDGGGEGEETSCMLYHNQGRQLLQQQQGCQWYVDRASADDMAVSRGLAEDIIRSNSKDRERATSPAAQRLLGISTAGDSSHRALTVRWRDADGASGDEDEEDAASPVRLHCSPQHTIISSPNIARSKAAVALTSDVIPLTSYVKGATLLRNTKSPALYRPPITPYGDYSCQCPLPPPPASPAMRYGVGSEQRLRQQQQQRGSPISPCDVTGATLSSGSVVGLTRTSSPLSYVHQQQVNGRLAAVGVDLVTERNFDSVSITDSGQGGSEEGEHHHQLHLQPPTRIPISPVGGSTYDNSPLAETVDKVPYKSRKTADSPNNDLHLAVRTLTSAACPLCTPLAPSSELQCNQCTCTRAFLTPSPPTDQSQCKLCATSSR